MAKPHETTHSYARTRANQGAFLAAYAQCCHIQRAADAAGIGRRTHYDWLRDDPEYAALFEEAKELATQVLEDAAVQRAVDGWQEPVFHEGKIVGSITKFSDRLLELCLRARRAEYRPVQKHELTGKDGKPLIPIDALDAIIHGAPDNEDTIP